MKLVLLCKYLVSRTIYVSEPVYNLNWLRSERFYDAIVKDNTICLVDVGARNVSVEELVPLKKHIRYIGFDADDEEVARLQLQDNGFKSSKFIAAYVGKRDSMVKFGIHRIGGNSSIYPFGVSYNKWFRGGDNDYLKEHVELQSRSLDQLIDEDVDVIKLDTQGSEFEILADAERCLDLALIVEVEVEFIQMYEGQKLAHDVFEFMHNRGFELLYLNRVLGQSSKFDGESRGQMIFGDALFGVGRDTAIRLPTEKKAKYVALLLNYGHVDFAYDVYSNSEDLKTEIPGLKKFFDERNRRSKFMVGIKSVVDKIIFLLLTIRRSNGLKSESDRSWPIR